MDSECKPIILAASKVTTTAIKPLSPAQKSKKVSTSSSIANAFFCEKNADTSVSTDSKYNEV